VIRGNRSLTATLLLACISCAGSRFIDRVWACDNPKSGYTCNGESIHAAMIVALYDVPGGKVMDRLHDTGNGIPCEILPSGTRWLKVRLLSGEIGYVDSASSIMISPLE